MATTFRLGTNKAALQQHRHQFYRILYPYKRFKGTETIEWWSGTSLADRELYRTPDMFGGYVLLILNADYPGVANTMPISENQSSGEYSHSESKQPRRRGKLSVSLPLMIQL